MLKHQSALSKVLLQQREMLPEIRCCAAQNKKILEKAIHHAEYNFCAIDVLANLHISKSMNPIIKPVFGFKVFTIMCIIDSPSFSLTAVHKLTGRRIGHLR